MAAVLSVAGPDALVHDIAYTRTRSSSSARAVAMSTASISSILRWERRSMPWHTASRP